MFLFAYVQSMPYICIIIIKTKTYQFINRLNKAVKSGTNIMTKKINDKVKKILNQYRSDNGYTSIVDFYNTVDDVVSGKFTDDVISFCDSNCSNGHYSRWTNFGNDLVNDARSFTDRVIDLQNS